MSAKETEGKADGAAKQGKGLKISVSGKGGVGKTTISALLARALAARGKRVLAIDADPVANLGASLGVPDSGKLVPIAKMSDLIAERTGAQPGTYGGFFKMNPTVDDIPDRFSIALDGVRLMVMGTVEHGGGGCVCPESVLLKALMTHLLLYRGDVVILDMEAGVEHLGRATSASVDVLVIVVDAGSRSQEAARTIRKLAQDIGVKRVAVVANRVRNEEEKERVKKSLVGFEILGFLPYDERIAAADRDAVAPFANTSEFPPELDSILEAIGVGEP